MSAAFPPFDAVVVGAGPAGAATAAVLAGLGVRVALIDRARFPREKLCGGLLSERSVGAIRGVFGASCTFPIEVTSTGATVFDREKRLVRVSNCKPVHFTSRRDFDASLVAVATSRGATLVEGTGVKALDSSAARIELEDGRVLSAPFVVGADGAGSRVRKLLGVRMDRDGFAIGLETQVPRDSISRDITDPEIYFGLVEWGYAWVFPKRTMLTVGIGGLAARNPDMRARFRQFAIAALGRVPDERVCGSPIPFGNFVVAHRAGDRRCSSAMPPASSNR